MNSHGFGSPPPAIRCLGMTASPRCLAVQEAALGCEIDWGKRDKMPTARTHPWRTAADFARPLNSCNTRLSLPSPQAITILRREYASSVAIAGSHGAVDARLWKCMACRSSS